ncbi:STAS domain-containing protein [Lentzea sp. CC55]|uniref:STAS domain-containing protein n=1 Tax=Lentzea sp. CC55 TaxID=2884909 RepID=UPI001F1CA08D|nr:STAS domain-containing protein [Lentzea sp. CC55]MCG8925028.1 STAS domain-containing protein [Lentzea sp. CC55]
MNDQHNGALDVLTTQLVEDAGVVVVVMTGEVDMMTERSPLAQAVEALEHAPAGLVIDLQGVTFFGSSGMALLLTVQQEAYQREIPFAVVAAHHAVLTPLAMTGTDVLLPLFATLPDALAAVRATPTVPSQDRR